MLYTIAIIAGYMFYVLSIFIHVLIIKKKISYKLVNGGRSESYEAQTKTSMMSVGVLCVGLVILVFFHIFKDLSQTLFGVITMGILSLYWMMGLVMQLLGTSFERKYVSIVLLLGVFSHVVIFIHYFIH